jgi:hypothetical protein
MPEIVLRDKAGTRRWLGDRHSQLKVAVLIWVLPVLVVTALVAINPLNRTVTHIYHQASANWWAGENLYTNEWGFLYEPNLLFSFQRPTFRPQAESFHYLPHFALVFSPFHWLPLPIGDILWRLAGVVLMVTGIWRFQLQQFGSDVTRAFLYASLLTMPLCLPSLRNGQTNLIFAALTLHAAACLSSRQWWRAAGLTVLALGIKPLGIVLLLLSVAVYSSLRLRLISLIAAMVLLPFLTAPASYVLAQYRQFLVEIQMCASVAEHRFADIGGIYRTFGWELPTGVSNLVRVAAAGLTLMLWRISARRLNEPFRALWLLALTTSYLMLFNPDNENCSYVILAPALGIWATAALDAGPTRRFGWLTACMSLSMGLLPNLLYPLFGNNFALFWDPAMTGVFMGMLIYWLQRPDSPFSRAPATQ